MIKLLREWDLTLNQHLNTIEQFLLNSMILSEDYIRRLEYKVDIGFNVFTLASDYYYRENFHSDIIKSFLDINESHNEGSKYLHLFIELLNRVNNKHIINKCDYRNAIVLREKSNIDILIYDDISKKAIIIENKINNAIDQKRQLPNYYHKIKDKYKVDAIVYITLDSSKRPDKRDWNKQELQEIDLILKVIPAFEHAEEKPNLYRNWIIPAIISSESIDSSLILRQYGRLIQYLNTNTMDTITLGKFYDSLLKEDNLKSAISIRNMLNELSEYLAIRIEDRYKEHCYPFKNVWRYQKRDTVFENFTYQSYYIKIDVWCDENGYMMHFWDTKGGDVISEFQAKISALSDFEIHEGNSNIKKQFLLGNESEVFNRIDEIIDYLKKIV